jgi:DNA-binding LytR/AlgR family response regulator
MEPDVLLDADVAEFDGLLKPVEVERLRTAIEGVAVLEDRSRQLQDFSLSPLTDSNRRPLSMKKGACVNWVGWCIVQSGRALRWWVASWAHLSIAS